MMGTPKVLYQFPEREGKYFMPSNGTEGDVFTQAFCMNCINCDPNPDGKKQCDIWARSMLHWMEPNHPEYPKEWVFNPEGWPVCTSWQKWDWNNDGDPDDPDNPKAPPPTPDPNQLNLFPLYPDENHFEAQEKLIRDKAV